MFLKFTVAGMLSSCSSWQDESSKETLYSVRLDFFGGSQSVFVSADVYRVIEPLPVGTPGRFSGHVKCARGIVSLVVTEYGFQGVSKDFAKVTDTEYLAGGTAQGIARVVSKTSYTTKDGATVHAVDLAVTGGKLTCKVPFVLFSTFSEKNLYVVTFALDTRSRTEYKDGVTRTLTHIELVPTQLESVK